MGRVIKLEFLYIKHVKLQAIVVSKDELRSASRENKFMKVLLEDRFMIMIIVIIL